MSRINLLPADIFIVINKTILSEYDKKIILMLYQPIIGSLATNLYFTFWIYLDQQEIISNEWSHHHLMSNLGIKLDSIIEAREKLEAIGLLKTYHKKDNIDTYLYELYSPISPSDFFVNPILNTALYSNIGKVEYQRVLSFFKLPRIDMKDYKCITKNFSDVFKVTTNNLNENDLSDIRKHSNQNLKLISNLDLNNIFNAIPDEMLNHKSITNEIKELIYKLSFIYNMDDQIMGDILKNSINDKKRIDKNLLQRNCLNYFKFENKGKLPNVAFKNQPEYLRKDYSDGSNKTKMIYTFESTPPIDFLANKNGGVITNNDRELLSHLLIELDLKPGVVNVLIDYVLRINDNKLIKKFVESVALQWKRSKIESVEAAMDLAKKTDLKMKNIKDKKVTGKKTEEKPEWFDQKINKPKATEAELEEINKLLSEYK